MRMIQLSCDGTFSLSLSSVVEDVPFSSQTHSLAFLLTFFAMQKSESPKGSLPECFFADRLSLTPGASAKNTNLRFNLYHSLARVSMRMTEREHQAETFPGMNCDPKGEARGFKVERWQKASRFSVLSLLGCGPMVRVIEVAAQAKERHSGETFPWNELRLRSAEGEGVEARSKIAKQPREGRCHRLVSCRPTESLSDAREGSEVGSSVGFPASRSRHKATPRSLVSTTPTSSTENFEPRERQRGTPPREWASHRKRRFRVGSPGGAAKA